MRILFAIAALLLIPSAAPAFKPAPIQRGDEVSAEPCSCCCRTQCLKPWSIADRWDDASALNHADWVGNGHWDHERFDDLNGNRLYDPGEPFRDEDGNGRYDFEFYHPFLTGYVGWKDNGRPIFLKPGSPGDVAIAGHYNALDFPSAGKQLESGNRYEWDIVNCNPVIQGPGDEFRLHPGLLAGPTRTAVLALVARDPDAHWDVAADTVATSDPRSPRIVFIALHDPRIEPKPGRYTVVVTKIAAFFIEGIDVDGNVIGRFMRVQSPDGGHACPPNYPGEAAFLTNCVK